MFGYKEEPVTTIKIFCWFSKRHRVYINLWKIIYWFPLNISLSVYFQISSRLLRVLSRLQGAVLAEINILQKM